VALQELVVDSGWVCWDMRRNAPRLNCRKWRMRHDYWLAGRYEKKLVEDIIEREFHTRYGLGERNVLIHRAPNPSPFSQLALEVFADGLRLGVLEYRLNEGWVLHPSGGLASILEGIGVAVVEAVDYPGRRVKGKKVRVKGDLEGLRWVIVDLGDHVGVGRVISRSDGVVKVKDAAPKGFKPLQASGVDSAVDANRDLISEASSEAIDFIKQASSRVSGGIAVSYSGGADSTASLLLTYEALPARGFKVVYVDTGMDLPGVREYAFKVLDKLGLEPYIVSSRLDPVAEIAKRGLPTRDNRWCTQILKLEPLRKFYMEHGIRLVIDGARSRESTSRELTPRIGENPLIPGVTRALPIKWWSRLLAQLYIKHEGVDANPLYDEGFTRLGCILCPAMHPHELELSYNRHREWFQTLEKHTGLKFTDILELLYGYKPA